ncbi:uncharacterized protein LOC102808674 [Saccoglossus kowalevskii]|uniref:Uncharacterized protein LOC102808674 n=1 Tax=Saccoglossus kowalevskii TaxID=10224 RepID=A0ABM0MJW7_SACKO|nr:PREDICTED: uncharacterized protein LOC102808674 [Saccoglossus kowalevskii]
MHQVIHNGGQKIIPVVLDDCAIPIEISHITPLDARNETFLERFLLAIFTDSSQKSKTTFPSTNLSKRRPLSHPQSRSKTIMYRKSLPGPILQPAPFIKLTGNIGLSVVKTHRDSTSIFYWMVDKLREEKDTFPQTIIYCSLAFYHYFKEEYSQLVFYIRMYYRETGSIVQESHPKEIAEVSN